MGKKIKVEQLRTGMYVSDLNCGWMNHPFVYNHFLVESPATIDRIRAAGVRELYIDPARGFDVEEAPTRAQVEEEIHRELRKIAHGAPESFRKRGIEEEWRQASTIKAQAQRVVHGLMDDIRFGRRLRTDEAGQVVDGMVDSVFRNNDALVSLCRVKESDEYTFQHSVSVCVLLIAFARTSGLERDTIQEIGIGALLHDVGKMRVPLAILNKPGRLTDAEFAVMKGHVSEGEAILNDAEEVSFTARLVAAQHHERFDGTGYPRGLRGEEISLFGQMAAIVDVYDAITSDRVYHQGMQPTAALRKLFEWSEFHFNKKLVHNFIHCVGIYPAGSLVRLQSGRLAVVLEQDDGSSLTPRVRLIYDTNTDRPLPPTEVALSDGDDRILDYEDPERWKLDPLEFIRP